VLFPPFIPPHDEIPNGNGHHILPPMERLSPSVKKIIRTKSFWSYSFLRQQKEAVQARQAAARAPTQARWGKRVAPCVPFPGPGGQLSPFNFAKKKVIKGKKNRWRAKRNNKVWSVDFATQSPRLPMQTRRSNGGANNAH
jgi:hypothetical protein